MNTLPNRRRIFLLSGQRASSADLLLTRQRSSPFLTLLKSRDRLRTVCYSWKKPGANLKRVTNDW